MQRSLYSFKVLTECPIIIVLLFQLYRSSNESHVEPFVPLVFKVPATRAPQAARPRSRADPPPPQSRWTTDLQSARPLILR